MKTITFCKNKYENNHLMLYGIYADKAMRNLCLSVADAIHFFRWLIKHYPFVASSVVVSTTVVFSHVGVGKVCAERDKLSHELYVMEQRAEQFENIKNR